jgi:TolB-like protein/DNA-binding winged helix-turn-helix (wHTH) protein/Tfp pilus assembly protein PilF
MSKPAQGDSSSETPIYRVGDLLIDLGQQRVWRGETELHLPKLSFELLLTLVRAAPNLISNDELMDRVWPGAIVSPGTLSHRVKLLRDALGDDAREPRYIIVSRGRGCRLTVPVSAMPADLSASPPVPAARVGQDRFTRHTATRYALHGTVVLGVIGLVSLLFIHDRIAKTFVVPLRASTTLPALPARTVAVLPFQNLSLEQGNDYLGLGIAEMVLNRLSQTNDLLVIARSSSFAFLGRNVDARVIGRELNARFLVQGSVQREGQHLRVTAQLVDAASGRQLKALRFDRELIDIFRVQDEISAQIAEELSGPPIDVRSSDVGHVAHPDLEAYLVYLQGRALLEHWRTADSKTAVTYFARAIEMDPDFALAYAELARANMQARYLAGADNPAVTESSTKLIAKALSLDPGLGEAYVMRAQLEIERDPVAAESDFRKGLELSPSYAAGYASFADALMDNWNRMQEALEVNERAEQLDPRVPRHPYTKANILFLQGGADRRKQAEDTMMHVFEIDPTFAPAYARLAEFKWLGDRGEAAEAVRLIEHAMELDAGTEWLQVRACDLYLYLGELAAAQQVVAPNGMDPTAHISIALYERDWDRAAKLALGRAASFQDWEFLPVYAVRVHALRSGKLRESTQFLQANYQLDQLPEFTSWHGWSAAPTVIFLLRKDGQAARAHQLDAALLSGSLFHEDIDVPYLRLAEGRSEEALVGLSEFAQSGRHFPYWWTMQDDPLWSGVRNDPRFVAFVERERMHSAGQRAILAAMVLKGNIPGRSGNGVAVPPADR